MVLHELVNSRRDRVHLLNYGARIKLLELRLSGGKRDVVLGYPNPEDYLQDSLYMGCTTGRYTNRIQGASFKIKSRDVRLLANEGAHQLHGGPQAFDKQYWSVAPGADEAQVEFLLVSRDGDQGFPGQLQVSVRYQWNDNRELRIEYAARSNRTTHVSLSNHAYFNLGERDDIKAHMLRLAAREVLELDSGMIPTGRRLATEGTFLDFTRRRRLDGAESDRNQPGDGFGIDVNYVLGHEQPAAELWSDTGDLKLSVRTSYPGLQVYNGYGLARPWRPFQGICLEPQYFPDSPNQPDFPSTLVQPGQVYREWLCYIFNEPSPGPPRKR